MIEIEMREVVDAGCCQDDAGRWYAAARMKSGEVCVSQRSFDTEDEVMEFLKHWTDTLTKPSALLPAPVAARKPPHGAPCNRCGVCCMVTLCELGQHLFKRAASPGPCPALVRDEAGDYGCDVVNNPQAYTQSVNVATYALRMAARTLIYAGNGCDARINGEPVNHAYHARCDAEDKKPAVIERRRRALKLWGMSGGSDDGLQRGGEADRSQA